MTKAKLILENKALKDKVAKGKIVIAEKEFIIEKLQKLLFGSKSERFTKEEIPFNQLSIFGTAQAEELAVEPAKETINERRTGYTKVRKVKSKDAKIVAEAIIQALLPYQDICKTITSDNGKEFSEHEYISKKLGIDFYFADPYSSWQRGANENYNGLLRQYFPKKTSFENITWREVRKAEKLLNNRPRKRLGYKNPAEVINSLTKVAFAA